MGESDTPTATTFRVQIAGVTHAGKMRTTNQDTIGLAGWTSQAVAGRVVTLGAVTARPVVCVLADGLGGHPDGGRASRVAVSAIADHPGPTTVDEMRAAMARANDAVYAEMDRCPSARGMGCTLAALSLFENRAFLATAGDTRVYRFADGALRRLSRDDRESDSNRVTRAVGGAEEHRPLDVAGAHVALRAGSTLLLCSDGLWELVDDATIADVLGRYQTAGEIAGVLLRTVLSTVADDNVSIVVATCREPVR